MGSPDPNKKGGEGHWTEKVSSGLGMLGQLTPMGPFIGPMRMLNKGLFGNSLGLLGAFMDDEQGGLFNA